MSTDAETADVVYVGTYSAPHTAPGESRPSQALGIYVFQRLEDGHLELLQTVPAENPSFLAISPNRKTLYAVSEVGFGDDGQPLGKVLAFERDLKTGKLVPLNSQATQGTWPCHLSVTADGAFLLAANYGSCNFVVFPLERDGRISAMSDAKDCLGAGPDSARQSQSHPHFIAEIPDLGYILGADLGTDQVHAWTLNASNGTLVPDTRVSLQMAGGTGPRHLVVHPESQWVIVLNELSSTIDIFSPASGKTRGPIWRQTLSTLPENSGFVRPVFDPSSPGLVAEGGNTTAEIRLHPNGQFLYVTNRGMNSIASFRFDETFQRLTPMEWTATLGERPRGMNVSPDGRFLYVGNQGSGNIVGFAIDPQTGKLSDPLFDLPCPTPVDFVF